MLPPVADVESRAVLLWLGPLFVVALGTLLLVFAGVTFHGPDQIRDMAIARALIHDGVWPLTGPPLFGGRVFLPPAYYWLLALPLLVHDSVLAVFVAFGAAFVLSVGYVWHRVRQALGPDVALLYVLLAFPVFATSYTHSAWNPALIMTLSNLLLGLFIDAVARRRRGWLLLPWVFVLLVQLHPSAAPLALGLLAYVLGHWRVLSDRRTLASVALLLLALALWIWRAGWPVDVLPQGQGAGAGVLWPALQAAWAHLGRLHAWRDLALLPWRAVASIHPALAVATPVSAVQQALLLGGLVAVLPGILHDRVSRWLALVAGLWLLLALAFLDVGLFWYADAVYPWLAVLSAAGWACVLRRLRTPPAALASVSVALFLGVFAGHLDFYRSWQHSGKITMRAAMLEFPQLSAPNLELPGYSFDYLQQMRQTLQVNGICVAQLAGVEATVMRDITARQFEPQCQARASGSTPARAYFMQRPRDAAGFVFARGLPPAFQVGSTGIYEPPYVPVTINGRQRSRLEGEQPAPGWGFGFPPQVLAGGVRIGVQAPGQQVVLRVGLRCDGEQAVRPERWQVHGATQLAPPRVVPRQQFTWTYYDVEWQLQIANQVSGPQIVSGATPVHCDVTAIARAMTPSPTP